MANPSVVSLNTFKRLGGSLSGLRHQDAGALGRSSSHPPPELVKLGKPESFRVLDDHDGGIGHIDPHLDDGGGHQEIQFTRQEGSHHPVLLLPGHLPVEEPQTASREDLCGQPFELGRGGAQIHLFRFVHQGIHHVPLPAGFQLSLHRPVDVRPSPPALQHRLHGGPARGDLVQEAQFQIAVERQGHGPGDGGGGHHQDVGSPLLPQRHPLPHTEAMLFVHHHQPQAGEPDLLLDQGVGAHHQGGPPVRQFLQGAAALGSPQSPREEDRPHLVEPGGPQEPGEGPVMLFRQQLRGGHEGGLIPALCGQEHGEEGHNRLPRPHVPLDHPVHPPGGGHVGDDLPENPGLGPGELEGEGFVEGADELVRPPEDDPRLPDGLPVPDLGLEELEEEELVEGQAATPPLGVRQGGGTMQDRQRLLKAGESHLLPVPRREILLLLEVGELGIQILPEDLPEDPLGEFLRGRVGHEDGPGGTVVPPALAPAPGHQRELPRLHLPPVEELHRTGGQDEVPLPELPLQPGLPGPGAGDHPRVVLEDGLEDPESGPGGNDPLAADATQDGGVLSHFQGAYRTHGRGVVVPSGHVEEEVPGCEDAQPLKLLRPHRPHPLQELDGGVQAGVRHTRLLLEDPVQEGLGVEGLQVVDPLPQSHQAHRKPLLGLQGHHDPPPPRGVGLRQDDPREVHRLPEGLGLSQGVLPHGGIQDDEGLVGGALQLLPDHPVHLPELVHEPFLGVQPAGGVHDDRIAPPPFGRLQGVEGHGGGISPLLAPDDLHTGPLPPPGQLLHGPGAPGIARGQEHLPPLPFRRWASFPMEVVFPTPFTPTMR
jgi:hypothetical protein